MEDMDLHRFRFTPLWGPSSPLPPPLNPPPPPSTRFLWLTRVLFKFTCSEHLHLSTQRKSTIKQLHNRVEWSRFTHACKQAQRKNTETISTFLSPLYHPKRGALMSNGITAYKPRVKMNPEERPRPSSTHLCFFSSSSSLSTSIKSRLNRPSAIKKPNQRP